MESGALNVDGVYCPAIPDWVAPEVGVTFSFELVPPAVRCSLQAPNPEWEESLTSFPLFPSILFWVGAAAAVVASLCIVIRFLHSRK